MNRRALYYETVRDGLVPVRNPYRLPQRGDGLVQLWCAEVTQDTLCYREGEMICAMPQHFVHKSRYMNGILYVRQANLPRLEMRRLPA